MEAGLLQIRARAVGSPYAEAVVCDGWPIGIDRSAPAAEALSALEWADGLKSGDVAPGLAEHERRGLDSAECSIKAWIEYDDPDPLAEDLQHHVEAQVPARVRFEGDALHLDDVRWDKCTVAKWQNCRPQVGHGHIPLEEALRRERAGPGRQEERAQAPER